MSPGRNDPCPCGSGQKFKHCCGSLAQRSTGSVSTGELTALMELLNAGRADEVERRAVDLVRSRPFEGMLWKVLGVSLMRQEKQALPALRRAAELLPQDPETRANLIDELINTGGSLREAGQRQEAIAAFEEAADLGPKRADAHFCLGRVLLESRRPRRAADSFRNAIAVQPGLVAAHQGLATALRGLGAAAEAQASCERALALAPESPDVMLLLGELRADRGQFAEAQELFERVRSTHPTYAPAYSSIASHRRMTRADDSWLQGVHALLATQLPLPDEVQLRYALGKYFDEVDDYDNAFDSYQRANELNKRLGGTYNEADLTALLERIIKRCDGSVLPGASDSEEPVFIIGMPRSGTSLAEQILASHSSVAGAGEVAFWDGVFERGPQDNLATRYLQRLHERARGPLRTIDKMPANFAYAGFIHSVFPRARIIHMQRHPLDTCLSIYFQSFFNVTAYANDLNHLAHYYGQYQRIMAHWRKLLPSHVLLEVPYEGLVQDPELWTRRMLEFIGLPWDPACLQFHENERAVITASRWQVRQKINAASVGRWRKYAKHLGPLRHLSPDDQ